MLTTIITGVLLAMFTSILAWQGKGRFDAIDRQFAHMRAEIASMRSEMISMHSDLTQVSLVAGARLRPETG